MTDPQRATAPETAATEGASRPSAANRHYDSGPGRTYASFGVARALRQIRHAIRRRFFEPPDYQLLIDHLREAEARMTKALGRPVSDLDVLEIGPGQDLARAIFFGRSNRVTAFDHDVIAIGLDPGRYRQMLARNGLARCLKSAANEVLIGHYARTRYVRLLGLSSLPRPQFLEGDICSDAPPEKSFDLAMTWSAFEHFADPAQALKNILVSLRPGGLFYVSIHLWTCNNGHHDIRSFTGQADVLPLWAHLRRSTQHLVRPSAYLNRWRLQQWRELFSQMCPGHTEILDQYEHPEVLGPRIDANLARELADYGREELLTVNAVFMGTKSKYQR